MIRTLFTLVLLGCASVAAAQTPRPASAASVALPSDYILLTVFMRHDQSKSLEELNKLQDAQEFWSKIPPEGVEVLSWRVAMGIGYIVTFKLPPAKLRELNRAIEQAAWGPFKTEYYITYDLTEQLAARRAAARAGTQPAATH